MKRIACILSLLAGFCLISFPAFAQEAAAAVAEATPADETASKPAPVLNGADTAWILTATALVLFMTIPGLSLFYAGMVGRKKVHTLLMQCITVS